MTDKSPSNVDNGKWDKIPRYIDEISRYYDEAVSPHSRSDQERFALFEAKKLNYIIIDSHFDAFMMHLRILTKLLF